MSEAIKRYRKSVENNYASANYARLNLYNHGWVIPENKLLAFQYAHDCASKKDVICMRYVADSYLTGNGVTKNDKEAEKTLIKLPLNLR